MSGNLQKRVSFSFYDCRICVRANNKANDLNSTRAGWAYFRMSNYKALNFGVFLIALAGLLSVIMPGSALGESGTISASIEIRGELVITNIAELYFGQVRPGPTDGTVTITTANERIPGGGTGVIGPKFNRAEFVIGGTAGDIFNIVLGVDFSVHDQSGNPDLGVNSLLVTDLISFSTTVGAEGTSGQINSEGIDLIFVGGTLVVPSTALNGSYAGNVILTVNF